MVFIGTSLKSVIKYFKRKGKIILILSVWYHWGILHFDSLPVMIKKVFWHDFDSFDCIIFPSCATVSAEIKKAPHPLLKKCIFFLNTTLIFCGKLYCFSWSQIQPSVAPCDQVTMGLRLQSRQLLALNDPTESVNVTAGSTFNESSGSIWLLEQFRHFSVSNLLSNLTLIKRNTTGVCALHVQWIVAG